MRYYIFNLMWLLLAMVIVGKAPGPCAAGVQGEQAVPQSMSPDMFASGMTLPVTGNEPFYELELPLAVYQKVTRRDLGDIRVFNKQGEVVPHALRRQVVQRLACESEPMDTPFFPLRFGGQEQRVTDISVYVKTRDGAIIDVNMPDSVSGAPAGKGRVEYLLDTGPAESRRAFKALELSWSPAAPDFMTEIRVETSANLIYWRSIGQAAIAALNYQGHELTRRRIELTGSHQRYLRLGAVRDQGLPELIRITGIPAPTYSRSPLSREWLVAAPVLAEQGDYVVDLGGSPPVDRVRIKLVQANSMAPAALWAGDALDAPMQPYWQGLLYNLNFREEVFVNDTIEIKPENKRYWRLNIKKSESGIGAAPFMEFGWQRDRLIFLARGQAPFTLAYGNAECEPPDFAMNSLLETYQSIIQRDMPLAKVSPGPPFVLGGDIRLRPPLKGLPWQKYLLWGVLVLGVLLIGWMSLSLYRSLRDERGSGPE